MNRELELYVHIPFCVKKCNYCDFLSFPMDDTAKENYVKTLIGEINLKADFYASVTSIYFGGGTPSTLKPSQLADILNSIKTKFNVTDNAEITIEINPGTIDKETAFEIKKVGFNRVSIGLQSIHEDELKLLGRIHTYKEFEEAYFNLREAGFENISVDVMTALPEQTEGKLLKTLNQIISLHPEHISAYSLIIEGNTKFYKDYGHIEGPVVGEEAERRLYYLTVSTIENAGYNRYEISNFAREGFESRHNTGYWTLKEYLGFGLGASSYINSHRLKNETDFKTYLNDESHAPVEDILINKEDSMSEFMFLGLRQMKGISKKEFYQKYETYIEDVFDKEIEKLKKEALILETEDRILLTDKGIDYGNYVFSHFLLQ